MNRPITRSDLYEMFADETAKRRRLAIQNMTASRAYADLADAVEQRPSQNEIADIIQRSIVQELRAKSADRAIEASRLDDISTKAQQAGLDEWLKGTDWAGALT